MADITANLLIDLDDSGSFSTDLCASTGVFTSGFWDLEREWALGVRGRAAELDAAGSASMVLSLDNADGRFSPANTLSPYATFFVNRFRPYKGAHVKLTFNGTTYDQIKGVITDIKIGPEAGQQLCEITIRDYMFVLSRTEIRRPLMVNQYTGVIVHRLLDDVEGAEGREACLNPAFAKDLTGWTTFGTATNLRMTASSATFEPVAEKILEGPGALYVLTSAVNSGARYTMTGKAGLKYTLVAYVKPESDAEIGASVQMRMADNVGTVATGTAGVLNRDYWVPIEVTGTYNGGSTSQFIDVFIPAGGVRVRVGAVHAVPFVSRMARDIDDGQSRLEKYSYHRGPALQAVQEVRENELGALFYFNGAGTAVFEDRHHRWRESRCLTSQVTLDERGVLDYSESGDDRIKGVILDYPHYVDGVAGTVVWDLDRVIPLPIGFTWPVEADYQGGLVRDTIEPVANTDYFISASWDGTGIDMTGSVTFTFDDFGGGSVGYFTNNATSIVYLRSYRVRGTPVRLASDRSPARYTPAGGPPLAATLSHDYQLNGSEPAIQAWAEYLGDRYSTQRERLGIALSSPFPEANLETDPIKPHDMRSILARTVSDRVTITNNTLPFASFVNGAYYIDSIDLRCTGQSLDASWRLSGVDDDYWVIAEAGSLLDTNTRLAA